MAKQVDLLSVEVARRRILAQFKRLGQETVSLQDALGRALVDPVVAGVDIPPFANSSMDGFAIDSTHTEGATPLHPALFRVTSHLAAGSHAKETVAPGDAARIMTGAPLPPGTDSVVPLEDVEYRDKSIAVVSPVVAHACVRAAGQDMRRGDMVIQRDNEISARDIGVLAALGYSQVEVLRKPIVYILSTGNELVQPGTALGPGQIYNSNSPMLAAAVEEAGAVPRTLHAVMDDRAKIVESLKRASDGHLIISSGGASVGDHDHMYDVIQDGGELQFWKVRLRPGKPLLFGRVAGLPIVALPGNPTSAMVTFELFVRPAIRVMLGLPPLRPRIHAFVTERVDNTGDRRTFARVLIRQTPRGFEATLAGSQDSAMLSPLARADGLMEIPETVDELRPGDLATVHLWRMPGEMLPE